MPELITAETLEKLNAALEAAARRTEPPAPLVSGTVIGGRYVVIEEADDIFGEYLAYDRSDARLCVVAQPPAVDRDGTRTCIMQSGSLNEIPNLHGCAYRDFWISEEEVFFVRPFVRGRALSDSDLRVEGWPQVLRRFRAAGHKLHAAHMRGCVHGGLTPENLIVEGSGMEVVRFGYTRAARLAPSSRWAAPEQLRGELGDACTDQFSFAAILKDALERLGGDEVPDRVWKAISKAMSADPRKRFESVGAMLDGMANARAEGISDMIQGGTVVLEHVCDGEGEGGGYVRVHDRMHPEGEALHGAWTDLGEHVLDADYVAALVRLRVTRLQWNALNPDERRCVQQILTGVFCIERALLLGFFPLHGTPPDLVDLARSDLLKLFRKFMSDMERKAFIKAERKYVAHFLARVARRHLVNHLQVLRNSRPYTLGQEWLTRACNDTNALLRRFGMIKEGGEACEIAQLEYTIAYGDSGRYADHLLSQCTQIAADDIRRAQVRLKRGH